LRGRKLIFAAQTEKAGIRLGRGIDGLARGKLTLRKSNKF